jgi:haloacetate dehalogenase
VDVPVLHNLAIFELEVAASTRSPRFAEAAAQREVSMFKGFEHRKVESDGVVLNVVHGGSGPALLLLHGYPQTHACWHRVAPSLAEWFTVVCPDLRGYGDSGKPPGDSTHRTYAKRTMARDQVAVMRALGFERFAVAGHDRGGRVARRLALDYPDRVTGLALLDIVPTSTIYATLDQRRATDVWRYFFLIQPYDLPERLIGGDAEGYFHWTLDHWCGTPGALTEEAVAEYRRCFDAATIHATCEDYRAGATVDLTDDAADAEHALACPLLLFWSERGLGSLYDVPACWRDQASVEPRTVPLDCGHFLPEEQPERVAAELRTFLR